MYRTWAWSGTWHPRDGWRSMIRRPVGLKVTAPHGPIQYHVNHTRSMARADWRAETQVLTHSCIRCRGPVLCSCLEELWGSGTRDCHRRYEFKHTCLSTSCAFVAAKVQIEYVEYEESTPGASVCPFCRRDIRAPSGRIEHENQPVALYQHASFKETCAKIATVFEEITLELIRHFGKNPNELQRIDWRRFEQLLDAIFRNQGFRTELGPGRGDGGVDLRLIQHDVLGEIITLVQAKRYSSHRPIKLEAVAALYAAVEDQKASRGLFVTTSRYLPGAVRFAEQQNRRLILADTEAVAAWCRSIGTR